MESTLKNLSRHIAACIGLIAAGALFAGQASAQDDDLIAKIKTTKKLDTAVGQSPAWSTADASGQASGIMPDIVRAFLKKQGIDATLNTIVMHSTASFRR
jgi:hypothetical protein